MEFTVPDLNGILTEQETRITRRRLLAACGFAALKQGDILLAAVLRMKRVVRLLVQPILPRRRSGALNLCRVLSILAGCGSLKPAVSFASSLGEFPYIAAGHSLKPHTGACFSGTHRQISVAERKQPAGCPRLKGYLRNRGIWECNNSCFVCASLSTNSKQALGPLWTLFVPLPQICFSSQSDLLLNPGPEKLDIKLQVETNRTKDPGSARGQEKKKCTTTVPRTPKNLKKGRKQKAGPPLSLQKSLCAAPICPYLPSPPLTRSARARVRAQNTRAAELPFLRRNSDVRGLINSRGT